MNNKIDITNRTLKFSVGIIQLVNKMPKGLGSFRLGDQIIRSGTSIGANIEEAQSAISKKDFIHKMNIGLSEARETFYWLKLLMAAKLIDQESYQTIAEENESIIKILSAIVKNTKINSK